MIFTAIGCIGMAFFIKMKSNKDDSYPLNTPVLDEYLSLFEKTIPVFKKMGQEELLWTKTILILSPGQVR